MIAAECDSLEAALACSTLRRPAPAASAAPGTAATAATGGWRLFLPLRVGALVSRADLACFGAACLLPREDRRWWSLGLQIPDGTRLLGAPAVLGVWSVDARTGLLCLEEDMSNAPRRWWDLAQRENPPEVWRCLSEVARAQLGEAITRGAA